MAQDGASSACEHRGQAPAAGRYGSMADGIDATVETMEASRVSGPLDGACGVAERPHLRGGDDAILGARQLR